VFDVARVEAGVAHDLHPFRWDVGNYSRDEIESGTGDSDALVGVGVDVPVGDQLPIIVGDVRGGQRSMTEIAADVSGGIEAFWVEAVGVDLVAAVVVVALIDSLLQLPIEGTSLTEVLAEQVAPLRPGDRRAVCRSLSTGRLSGRLWSSPGGRGV
jgi:hypothetical protein